MRAIERLNERRKALETMGDVVREESRARGVSVFYADDSDRHFIIEELPDGTKIRRPFNWKANLNLAAE